MCVNKQNKKILICSVLSLILTSCGGGGGGSSSITVQPDSSGVIKHSVKTLKNDQKNETGDPTKKGHASALKKLSVMPFRNIQNKNLFVIPKDDRKIDGKGQIVAIMDSDFLTHKDDLKAKYETIEILDKISRNPAPNKSPHGERVLELMTEDAKFNIIAGSIGEKLGDKIFVAPSLEIYKEIFIKFGNQKVKIINQSWGLDFKDNLKNDSLANKNYRSMLLPLQIVREDEKMIQSSQEEINRRGEELMNFYSNAVEEGGLFIWANGNRNANGNTLEKASLQPSLPLARPSLEKGWLSVIGVEEKDPVHLGQPDGDYYAYKHYAYHLAYPGAAARWSISASAEGPESGKGTIGSSYAAPRVARAAALVANKFNWMTNSQVRETLLTTTDKPELKYDRNGKLLETDDPRLKAFSINDVAINPIYGWGILNTERALKGPGAFLETLLNKDNGYNLTNGVLYFQANISEGQESYFENDIFGDSALRKSGKGRLHLTGNNTFSGTTKIAEGTLDIYKQHKANIDIEKKGTLVLYDGAVVGEKLDNEKIAVANVQNSGKLIVSNKEIDGKEGVHATITGTYTVSENGITEIDFDSSLDILGKADLSQSTLKITSDKYTSPVKKREIIKGNIDNINIDKVEVEGMRKAAVSKNDNGLIVEMNRENALAYLNSEYASSQNTASNVEKVLHEIDNKITDNRATSEDLARGMAIINMSHEEFQDSVNKMSGEIYASAQALTFAQAQNINRNISNHLGNIKNFKYSDYEWQGWMTGAYSKGKLKDKGYATGKTTMNGQLFGIDKKIDDSTQIGINFVHSNAKAEFDKYAGESKSDSTGISIYAKEYFKNNSYLLGRIGGTEFTSKVQRELVDINGKNEIGNIKHKDKMISTYIEVGKHFKYFTPYIGYSFDYLSRGEFKEKNAAWGINAPEKRYYKNNLLLGVRGEYTIDSYKFSSYITHSLNVGNRSLDFKGTFTGTDIVQEFKGINQIKNTTWAGVDVTKEFKSNIDINFNVDFRFENGKKADSLFSTGIQYRF